MYHTCNLFEINVVIDGSHMQLISNKCNHQKTFSLLLFTSSKILNLDLCVYVCVTLLRFTLSTLKKCLPLFVLGFIATACVRSFGDSMLEAGKPAFGLFNKDEWKGISDTIGNKLGGRYLLGTAMAGVGLSTSIANIKQGGLGSSGELLITA